MKNIFMLIVLTSIGMSAVKAQQLPHYSQYMYDQYFINPAVAGSKSENVTSLTMRSQWVGLDGSPNTQVASFNGPLRDDMGVGVLLFNDNSGPFRQSGLQLSYAYKLDLGGDQKLAFGLSGMLYQHVLDKSILTTFNPNDNALVGQKEKSFAPDASFGMYYSGDNYFAGLSIPQLIQTKLNFNEMSDSSINRLARHYFFTGGYKFEVSDEFEVEPSLLFKAMAHAPVQLDLNAKVIYKEFIWLGLSYRHKESVVAMIGGKYDKFVFGYSYDFTLSNIRSYSSGSHEIYLGMRIPQFNFAKASL